MLKICSPVIAEPLTDLINRSLDFQEIIKGVPQGSILGPVLFIIFIDDILRFLQKSKLYNYADDDTISYASCSIPDLVT